MNRLVKVLCFLIYLLFPCLALAIEPDTYEPDNDMSQAKPITSTQLHNFHSATDTDWVRFNALIGRTYGIKAGNVGSGCDVALEIYNSSGTKIGGADKNEKGMEEYFDWECPSSGTYFVKAYLADPIFTGIGTEYSLSVEDKSGTSPGYLIVDVRDVCDCTRIEGRIKGAISLDGRNDNFIFLESSFDGHYDIEAEAAIHSLTVSAYGYVSSVDQVSVYQSPAKPTEKIVCLEKVNGSRSGVITDVSNGQGIKGATILLNGNVAATTGDVGSYSITTSQGTYTATVQATGYQSASAPVTIRCDISNANLSLTPTKTYYKDLDNDGYSDGNSITSTTRPDGYKLPNELIAISGDCNDNDPNIHPGAPEICDGKDNNCNNQVDEGFPLYTYYRDADGDGYGDSKNSIQSCSPTPPAGYITNKDDCNDSDSYNKGLISGSIINKCSGEGEKVSDVKITVSGNGKTETIDAAGGKYAISFVPNIDYTVTFEADGYEKIEYPEFKVKPCDNLSANICLTKTDLSYVITVLRVLSGIDIKLPECINSQVDMSQAIRVLQAISGLRK